MDAGVYDHIQSEALARDTPPRSGTATPSNNEHSGQPGNITTDLQETYKSLAASPWGTKLGGLWGSVNKQAASYIQEAQKEASAAGQSAFKGFTELKSSLEDRARTFSAGEANAEGVAGSNSEGKDVAGEKGAEGTTEAGEKSAEGGSKSVEGGEDDAASPAFISRFRSEASKRLADLQRAEDAADEALLKFGSNIRNFLRDAVTVTPPAEGASGDKAGGKDTVLFESKDAEGKRVMHATRFDAQLHVIHCSLDSFTKDPASPEWAKWVDGDGDGKDGKAGFDVESRTDDIARDLARYPELRTAMERLVPERVEYGVFWRRYYFLRMVIESEERRRREMLKDAASKSGTDADLAWDDDSDEEGDGPSTPQPRASSDGKGATETAAAAATPLASSSASAHLREPRKSNDEKSTAGSESSYDLVSGATSAAPGSPQERKDEAGSGNGNGNGNGGGSSGSGGSGGKKKSGGRDDSDEEDWE